MAGAMSDSLPTCVNHPHTETRLSCSACGDPICTRCMRQAAVGQKCPQCAQQSRSARALGKPIHYVRSIGAGLAVAIVGGVIYVLLVASIGFGALLLAAALGYGVGRTVRWGTRGQSQSPFTAIAAACAVAGVAIGYVTAAGVLVPAGLWGLLAYPVAGWFGVRGLQS